jgi:hypothetical protein
MASYVIPRESAIDGILLDHTVPIEAAMAGAKPYLVDGLIHDCGRIVRQGKSIMGWFDLFDIERAVPGQRFEI